MVIIVIFEEIAFSCIFLYNATFEVFKEFYYMKTSIIEIIIFIYQHYLEQSNTRLPELEQWLMQHTKLNDPENQELIIGKAHKNNELEKIKISPNDSTSIRVYSFDEIQKLDSNCRGYILHLEQQKVISPKIREKIIQAALTLDKPLEPIDIEFMAYDIISQEMEDHDKISHLHKIFTEHPNIQLH